MAQRRVGRPLWPVGVGLLAVALWFGAPHLLRRLDFFRVRKVEFRGLEYLDAEDLTRSLPIPKTMSVFDDLGDIRRVVDSTPGLTSLSLHKRLPGTVVIEVREQPAIGLVMRGGKLRLIGEDGRVLPFDPMAQGPDLPIVAEADTLVARLLVRVRDADATLFGRVVSAARIGDDVALRIDSQRYLFRPDAATDVIRAAVLVAQDLEKKGRRWAELDARFAGQVVVRWEAA